MKRKISCRVIDSVPLPAEGDNRHLGWSLDMGMYSNSPSLKTHRRGSFAKIAQIYNPNNKSRFDSYA